MRKEVMVAKSDTNSQGYKVLKPREAKEFLNNMGFTFHTPDDISTMVKKDPNARTIIIPISMDKMEAAEELEKQWHNEEQIINVDTDFTGYNWKDVLVAIKKVTEIEFGWINGITRPPTFFSPGSRPSEIDVVVDLVNGKEQTEKAFFGEFEMSCYENAEAKIMVEDNVVYIRVRSKKKYSDDLTGYYNKIRQHLATDSIYRGKSVVVTGRQNPNDGTMMLDFEIIENRGSENIVLNHDESVVIDNFILSSLEEPGKKCYLFTGPYGNGKTETAMMIGREAVNVGITFFYLKDSALFDFVLNNLKKYQPAILFVEDIDEIASGSARDERMNKILNTLDGVQTKGNSLTVILTTNHERKINPALRRPGRIDLIVKFSNPNDEAKGKIYEKYFRNMLPAEAKHQIELIDFTKLAAITPDVAGAVIAEICSRAIKLFKKTGKITHETIDASIVSMKHQIQLMAEDVEEKQTYKLNDLTFTTNGSSNGKKEKAIAN